MLLPTPITFDPYLHTPKDHLFPATKVDTELHHIPVIDSKCTRLLAWRTQAHMIQEGTWWALHILDVPLSILAPELTVPPAHNLALESYWCRRWRIRGDIWRIFTLWVPSNFDDGIFVR
jgi:hypothetical protein